MLAMIVTTPAGRAQNSVLTTLHTFGNTPGFYDGVNPNASLLQAVDGNFYGPSSASGNGFPGTIFRLTPSGSFSVFANGGAASGPDTSLIQAADGSFYGGASGTVFRVTSDGTSSSVVSVGPGNVSSVIQGSTGDLYGTFGSAYVPDTVFQINLAGVLSTLYTFDSTYRSGSFAALIQATDGNFYGTTSSGGTSDKGTIFRVADDGTFATLHNFSGTDGNDPESNLIQASDGNFYGTTVQGGASDAGTVFRLTPSGVFTTLYSFTGGNDGAAPYAGLIQATDGNLYGTTRLLGGGGGNGTIFKITPAGVLTTLYAFTGGSDGIQPNGVIQATDGSFWGTTRMGGANNGQGTVFRFGVVPAGVVQFSSDAYNVRACHAL